MNRIIFIDIESVGKVEAYDHLDEQGKKLRNKKSAYMQKQQDISAKQAYNNKGGIFAEFGKIVCICIGYHDEQGKRHEKSFAGDEEKLILEEFAQTARKRSSGFSLCGHNIVEFDMPYIIRRMLIHKIQLPKILQLQGKKPREIPHIDTLNMRKCGDRKNYTSLELLAYCLGIPSPKEDIDGSMVHQTYHKQKDLVRITQYCSKDVQVTAQVYYALTQNYELLANMPNLS